MEGVIFRVVFILLTFPSTEVDGILIESLPGTKTDDGLEPLKITCRASSADAARHNGLTLSRSDTSTDQNLVTTSYENPLTHIQWASQTEDFQSRARATGEVTYSSSLLTVDVLDFKCSDAGIYKCTLTGTNQDSTPVVPSPSATATLGDIGKNGNIRMSVKENLEAEASQTTYNDTDLFFKEGTVLKIECRGDLGTQNQNRINWYTLPPGQSSWERYLAQNAKDVSSRTVEVFVNSCLQRVISTLKYNVSNSDDGGTAFQCRTSSTLGGLSESNQIRIFAGSNGNGGSTDSENNDGMIAGIVIGVIGVIAILLVGVCIYFRKRIRKLFGKNGQDEKGSVSYKAVPSKKNNDVSEDQTKGPIQQVSDPPDGNEMDRKSSSSQQSTTEQQSFCDIHESNERKMNNKYDHQDEMMNTLRKIQSDTSSTNDNIQDMRKEFLDEIKAIRNQEKELLREIESIKLVNKKAIEELRARISQLEEQLNAKDQVMKAKDEEIDLLMEHNREFMEEIKRKFRTMSQSNMEDH